MSARCGSVDTFGGILHRGMCLLLVLLTAFPVAGAETQAVAVRGVVTDVIRDEADAEWNWVTVRTESGSVAVSVAESICRQKELESFVDAEISIRGRYVSGSTQRQFLGRHLHLRERSSLSVLRPAPADPFASVRPLSWDEKADDFHRQLVRGTVAAVMQRGVLVRLEDAATHEDVYRHTVFVRLAPGVSSPQTGTAVEVVGFPVRGFLYLRITNALIRHSTGVRAVRERSQKIEMSTLFSKKRGRVQISGRFHGQRVVLDGLVSHVREGEFELSSDGHSVFVDTASDVFPVVRQGALVRVTGVLFAEFDEGLADVAYPPFRRFILVPGDSAEVMVIRPPPWWTVKRLVWAVAVLGGLLAGVLLWNWALTRRAERRARELSREQIENAGAQLKVEERTRLAVELHDSLSQMLTGVSLQLDAVSRKLPETCASAWKFLTTAKRMLASCRQELRCCLWDLRSRTFEELDMNEAIRRTLAPYVGDVLISVRFNVPRERLSELSAHATLRMTRELVMNAIRHGAATVIRIAGEVKDGCVRFSVSDNGAGFDMNDIPGPEQGHFGLHGIRERIAAMDGDLKMSSVPGKGSKFVVQFKMRDVNNA